MDQERRRYEDKPVPAAIQVWSGSGSQIWPEDEITAFQHMDAVRVFTDLMGDELHVYRQKIDNLWFYAEYRNGLYVHEWVESRTQPLDRS